MSKTKTQPEPQTLSDSGLQPSLERRIVLYHSTTIAPNRSSEVDEKEKRTAAVEVHKANLTDPVATTPLDTKEQAQLAHLEDVITRSAGDISTAFFSIADAFFRIHEGKLYRGTHKTFEAYASEKWDYSRSHAYRLTRAGEVIHRQKMSPREDIARLLNGEAHFRALHKLNASEQDLVLDRLKTWLTWTERKEVTPRMVESAALVLHSRKTPSIHAGTSKQHPLAARFVKAVEVMKKKLPEGTPKTIHNLFEQLKKKAAAVASPPRRTGIDWTDATWNPLQGCSRASAGCDYCYAAKLVATRLSDVYPGLAKEVRKDGKKTFIFNNVIRLLPDQLGEPLRDHSPKRYFVNSMSDLFHVKVPDEFIAAVFDVMKLATWHEFQVLTKRPERMAAFTQSYFANEAPPPHIWLGTSTEDQDAYDKRVPHLLETKAAVRWLSMEPLLGPVQVDSLEGIDWVVVGGESGSTRKMDVQWARSIRDACAEAGTAFFFKQWGEYGPDGKKLRKAKKDGLTPPPLDGEIHNAYPTLPDEDHAPNREAQNTSAKSTPPPESISTALAPTAVHAR